MAQDVNQSETDVAAQVRSVLVARISRERYELWLPTANHWHWDGACLSIRFPSEFARQMARRLLHKDLRIALSEIVGEHVSLELEVRESDKSMANASDQTTGNPILGSQISGGQIPGSQVLGNQIAGVPIAGESDTSVQREAELASEVISTPSGTLSDTSDPFEQLPETEPAIDVLKGKFGERGKHKAAATTKHSAAVTEVKSVRPAGDQWMEFVRGSSNQMAWTSINMIANDPGSLTPALVHGPYGVGKSHLGAALAQRLRTQKRQRRVLHITAEQFTNDFTEAIRGGGLPMMRRKYRDVDTLILDDLHFLLGKKATIGELRQTLDNLLKAGRQVVFLSDRPPNELEGLGDDFLGRLRGGLVSPLLPLDEETRYQILRRDLIEFEVKLSDEIVMQIAARAIGDGRLLKGIVNRLRAAINVVERSLTWDDCWNAIYDLVQATQPIVRLGDIERVVCEVFGLEPNSLQSDRKTRQVSQPRMLAMFLARKYTPAAYQEIGEYFGKRRHSTVISAEKTVGAWLEDNTAIQVSRGSLCIRDAVRHVEAHLHVG